MSTQQTKLFGTYNALQVGDRGIQVTLPSKYCKANGIKPGTPLDLFTVEGENYLIIRPHREEQEA